MLSVAPLGEEAHLVMSSTTYKANELKLPPVSLYSQFLFLSTLYSKAETSLEKEELRLNGTFLGTYHTCKECFQN